MEFTDDICQEMDFLLSMRNRCKDVRTQSVLTGLINVVIEHNIMGEYLVSSKGKDWLKERLNRGKKQFKDRFQQYITPHNRKPEGL